MTVSTKSKTVIPNPLKGISDDYGRLHLQLARMGVVLPYHLFGLNQKGNQENGFIILLDILRPESELESESLESLRLCSLAGKHR